MFIIGVAQNYIIRPPLSFTQIQAMINVVQFEDDRYKDINYQPILDLFRLQVIENFSISAFTDLLATMNIFGTCIRIINSNEGNPTDIFNTDYPNNPLYLYPYSPSS